jgi:hypothetical protein
MTRDIRVEASGIGNSALLHDEARTKNSDKAQVAKAPRDGANTPSSSMAEWVGLTSASGSGVPSQR